MKFRKNNRISRASIKGLAFTGFILFCIQALFRVPISNLAYLTVVKPFFESYTPKVWTDVLIIALLIVAIYKIAKHPSPQVGAKVAVYGQIIYWFQRYNEFWDFFYLALLPKSTYWDLLGAASFLPFLIGFLIKNITPNLEDETSNTGFLEDKEIDNYEDDHFKRRVTATEIAHLIYQTKNKKSFAIGILGEYGTGKTSFLNLICNEFDSQKILKIEFDPWRANSPEEIRRSFFDQLATKIALLNFNASSTVYGYGRKLANFNERSVSFLNWFYFLRNLLSDKQEDEHYQVNELLKKVKKKIVIIIDDLDRLHPKEIMEVLKLIRNTANFSNVIYLVAYDKDYLQHAVKDFNRDGRQDYLDKIFQLEIPLPKREEDDLLAILSLKLKNIVSEEHYDDLENNLIPRGFKNPFETGYAEIFRQGRDVVRFINSFKLTYQLIGSEVAFKDLLILELIKTRYPVVYDLIYTHSKKFLSEAPVYHLYELYYSPNLIKNKNNLEEEEEEEEEETEFKKYIETLGNLLPKDVNLLDKLFKTLFNGGPYSRPEPKNSISYPLYFEIYFRNRLSQRDISDKEYRNAIRSGTLDKFMKYCASHDLHKEIIIRLFQEDVSRDRLHFEMIIRSIFSFGRTFVQKESADAFDYSALIKRIDNFQNFITDKFYKKAPGRYKEFLEGLFHTALAPYTFENQLIFEIKELRREDFAMPFSTLSSFQSGYFNRMAESGHGLSRETLWLFFGGREYYYAETQESLNLQEHWRFIPDSAKLMKEYIKKLDPINFLKFSINRDLRNPSIARIIKQVLDIFDNPNELRNIIIENDKLDENIKNEYLMFFDLCASVNFEKYVEIEFHTMLKETV